MAMAISPGTMNSRYSTPSTCRIRPLSDSPKTTMKSVEEMTGASTVWVHSFDTRSVSRRASQMSPAVPLTGRNLGGADQLPQIVKLARPAEVPALAELRAHRAQLLGLLLRLDPLGHDLHPERPREHDHSTHDGVLLAVAPDLADERAVDLQHVDLRHLSQVQERREADPKVVDRQPHADVAQRAQAQQRRVRVGEERALGDLEAELRRVYAGSGDDRTHVVYEAGVAQLAR